MSALSPCSCPRPLPPGTAHRPLTSPRSPALPVIPHTAARGIHLGAGPGLQPGAEPQPHPARRPPSPRPPLRPPLRLRPARACSSHRLCLEALLGSSDDCLLLTGQLFPAPAEQNSPLPKTPSSQLAVSFSVALSTIAIIRDPFTVYTLPAPYSP